MLSACDTENRILVTLDLDFANIRDYPPGSHKGIWVLRPAAQTFDAVLHLVLSGVKLATAERTAGQLWVIDDRRVRIRELVLGALVHGRPRAAAQPARSSLSSRTSARLGLPRAARVSKRTRAS